jgi:hypothetical protein
LDVHQINYPIISYGLLGMGEIEKREIGEREIEERGCISPAWYGEKLQR